ncbi:MAG: hypothetical protein ABIJ14_03785 [Nanoarchaeota archaeon]
MVKKPKDKSSVVKIDSLLLKKTEEFIKKEENRLKFVNKKQLIDIAVYEYLKKVEGLSNEK